LHSFNSLTSSSVVVDSSLLARNRKLMNILLTIMNNINLNIAEVN
jgi:hypothetical protein